MCILQTLKILDFMKILRNILIALLVISIWLYIYLSNMTPSLDKDWAEDQKILTNVEIGQQNIYLKNIRSFRYTSTDDYEVWYFNDEYSIWDVVSVDYIIEPFGEKDGFAHTMLSFWMRDGRYLSVSAEIRKELWESFHPLLGLLNAYEIVYMIGDEEDLIKLRANYRKDTVILYPMQASEEEVQKLFVSVMQRAKSLSKHPEFYNTITNTCTTSILEHINALRAEKNKSSISWWKKILLPSYSDEVAYELGLINTKLSLSEAREYYTINTLSESHTEGEDYSKLIRKEIK